MGNGISQVDEITVSEDIGHYEPVYKRVKLILWSDGTVTWERVEE